MIYTTVLLSLVLKLDSEPNLETEIRCVFLYLNTVFRNFELLDLDFLELKKTYGYEGKKSLCVSMPYMLLNVAA